MARGDRLVFSPSKSRKFPKSWGDFSAALLLWLSASFVVSVLLWILGDILIGGLSELSLEFLSTAPSDAGRSGGILPIITSTLLILSIAIGVSLPLSLGSSIVLAEGSSGFVRLVRRALDVLAAVPSIVFGLFGNAFFCIALGMGYSILAGGLTLACMVLPILTRTTEQAIRNVPDEYRFGAASLGLSKFTTIRKIILPIASPALGAGFVLGIGRALAETAALLFTSGYVTRQPESLLDSGRALSVHIYDMAMNVPGGNERAYAAAAVLILLLLAINSIAMALMRLGARNNSNQDLINWR